MGHFGSWDILIHGTFCPGTFLIAGQSVTGQFARAFLSGDSLSWDNMSGCPVLYIRCVESVFEELFCFSFFLPTVSCDAPLNSAKLTTTNELY